MKKFVSSLLIMVLLLGSFSLIGESDFASAKETSKELRIQELYGKRAKLLTEENVDHYELMRVEKELEKLGVEFLSPSQVRERFPKRKNEKYLTD